jgi:hypothetical protein
VIRRAGRIPIERTTTYGAPALSYPERVAALVAP